MNNIINFLCLPDNDIEVTNIEIIGDTKYVYISVFVNLNVSHF